MGKFPLAPADLARVRFGVSETWETVISIRTLQVGGRITHHQPWLNLMRNSLDPATVRPLMALVSVDGYIPDSLTPMVRDNQTFDEALDGIRATPVSQWDAELDQIEKGVYAQRQGPGAHRLRELLHGAKGRDRIAELLDAYHRVAIAPFWSRLRALDLADIAHRTELMASGGVQRVFADLHPKVSLTPEGVIVNNVATYRRSTGDGLLLVPSAFAWPEVFNLQAERYLATIIYSARGIGNLWTEPSTSTLGAVERLIGPTRARILRQLDIAVSTSQVAAAMEISKSTANEHLKILQATGLVTSSRSGREVLYHRTRGGDDLLSPR